MLVFLCQKSSRLGRRRDHVGDSRVIVRWSTCRLGFATEPSEAPPGLIVVQPGLPDMGETTQSPTSAPIETAGAKRRRRLDGKTGAEQLAGPTDPSHWLEGGDR